MPILSLLLAVASLLAPPSDRQIAAAEARSVRVDGVLDEAEWATAEVATDFVQYQPDEGSPSSQVTQVRVLRTGDALYIGAELSDTDPSAIRRTLSRRDDSGGADAFTVAIDSYRDGRTARLFGVTAAGVQYDGLLEGSSEDYSWDAVWASSVRLTPTGWVAEIRIPYSQLRFSGVQSRWGINFIRDIPRFGEESYWAPFTLDQAGSGIVQFFGTLSGLEGVRPRRLVQAVPYTLASGSRSENGDAPGVADYGSGFDAGADVKIGLTPSIILDATINPDFGQVEVDPAELNLSTFETFFSERRPFFLEGTQIFDSGFSRDGAVVYTRRIGGSSPIIGATKLTGRTPRGLSFGAIAAATGEDFEAERLYGIVRAKQEFGSQNFAGVTAGLFDGTGDDSRASGAGAQSMVGSTDWQFRFGPGDAIQAEGVLSGSLRDTPGGSSSGFAMYTGLDQVRGYTRFGSGFRIYSPNYWLNDVGRFRETDRISTNGAFIRQWNDGQPFGPIRRLQSFLSGTTVWRYSDGTFRGAEAGFNSSGELTGFQQVSAAINVYGIGGFDVRETRGLGPVENLLNANLSLSASTDTRKQFVAELGGSFLSDIDGGYGFGPELSIDWTASDRVRIRAAAEFEVANGLRAWVENEGLIRTDDDRLLVGRTASVPEDLAPDDLIDTGLDASGVDALLAGLTPSDVILASGTGYFAPVFGSRDYRSADLTVRANVILNPSLSLQIYGQMFAARGQYRSLRLLAAPSDLRDFDAYPKRRDFSVASLTANAVMRWEYRPGSSLFLVWQHAAGDDLFENVLRSEAGPSPFEATTTSLFGDALRAFGDDIVLIKLSYLLSR